MAEQLSFKVAQVEGPLDLILQLISKHKLNIYDIEITKLLEQYMDYIQQVQSQQMEIASEFLEMASRLVYIKSVSLLPKHEELEEQLKQELTGQLIEYTLCRQVAQLLKKRYVGDELFYRASPSSWNGRLCMRAPTTRTSCWRPTCRRWAEEDCRRRSRKAFEPMMARRVVSVQSRIVVVMKILYRQQSRAVSVAV